MKPPLKTVLHTLPGIGLAGMLCLVLLFASCRKDEKDDLSDPMHPCNLASIIVGGCGCMAMCKARDPIPAITQGVYGRIRFLEGDFMPPGGTGTTEYVVRSIRIHEPTSFGDVTVSPTNPTLLVSVNTPLAGETLSDFQGFYEFSLPPGTYSLFTEEDVNGATLYYANGTNGAGVYQSFTITENALTEFNLDITYAATF